jgi:hypothetical protein
LKLMGIRTLPSVLHIPGLTSNLIYVSKMDDTGVKILFEKETYRVVQGAMVLMKGVQIGTLYKLLKNNISYGSNNFIVPKIGVEEGKNLVVYGEKIML